MSFNHPQPLIVCGYVRSGTQMCAAILRNSKDVELQGEIPPVLGKRMFRWLQAVKREQQHGQAEELYALCRSTFRHVTPPAPLSELHQVRWFGHKTPRHESLFPVYEGLFDHVEARPRYVYCLRNPFHVWRSYRVMPWNSSTNVRRFARHWIRSVEAFEGIKSAAPDRVSLFHLDDMLAAEDRLAWLKSSVLDSLAIDPETFRKPLDALRNSNSAESKFGMLPPEVPTEELALIAGRRKIGRIIREYFPDLEEEARQLAPVRGLRLIRRRDRSSPAT